MNRIMLKCLLSVSICCLSITGLAQTTRNTAPPSGSVTLLYDHKVPQFSFAAQEIRRALTGRAVTLVERNFDEALTINDGTTKEKWLWQTYTEAGFKK